jgi:hypothetical protein
MGDDDNDQVNLDVDNVPITTGDDADSILDQLQQDYDNDVDNRREYYET